MLTTRKVAQYGGLFVALVLSAGCTTSPNWKHPGISNQIKMDQQLVRDKDFCTLVSYGAAPMPVYAPPVNPLGVANVNIRGSTYDSKTGNWSHSTYTGQVTTGPSGGFAGGLASGLGSGLALGAAIKAQQRETELLNACMRNLGWEDSPNDQTIEQLENTQYLVPSPNSAEIRSIVQKIPAYPSAKDQWKADFDEFAFLFPGYKDADNWKRLDTKVRQVASELANATGSGILWVSHKQLQEQGVKVNPAQGPTARKMLLFYGDAASGLQMDQIAIALVIDEELGKPPEKAQADFWRRRSLFWIKEAAISGDPHAIAYIGIRLIGGDQVPEDKKSGYRLLEFAAQKDSNIKAYVDGLTSRP